MAKRTALVELMMYGLRKAPLLFCYCYRVGTGIITAIIKLKASVAHLFYYFRLTSPMLLIVLGVCGGAVYYVGVKSQSQQKMKIMGK